MSDFVRQTAIDQGVSPSHVQTLHNPSEPDRFNVVPERVALRAEFGWSADAPVIVSVGRLDPSKGHMLLLEAFARVQEKLPEARLLICGTPSTNDGYDRKLKQRSLELGLSQSVVFAGARSDIPRIFASADVFCLPTVLDACPMVFLEAMAASLPAVALRSGGVPELVSDSETGLLSALDDAEALATNMLTILSNPSLRQQFGAAGRNRALTQFAPTRVAAKWLSVLDSFMANTEQAGKTIRST